MTVPLVPLPACALQSAVADGASGLRGRLSDLEDRLAALEAENAALRRAAAGADEMYNRAADLAAQLSLLQDHVDLLTLDKRELQVGGEEGRWMRWQSWITSSRCWPRGVPLLRTHLCTASSCCLLCVLRCTCKGRLLVLRPDSRQPRSPPATPFPSLPY